MGVLIGLVAVNAGAFIEASKYEPPARVLGKAVKDSFYFASETKRTAYLSYFEENATFFVSDASGKILANHEIFQKEDLEQLREDDLLPRVVFRARGPLAGLAGGDSFMTMIFWSWKEFLFILARACLFKRRSKSSAKRRPKASSSILFRATRWLRRNERLLQEKNLSEAFSGWLYADRGTDRPGFVRDVGCFSRGRREPDIEGNRRTQKF